VADPITIALVATTVLSVGAQVFSGISQKKEADDRAEIIQDQARIEREETEAEVGRRTEERNRFIAKQKVAFLASGVGLAGTPLIVLEDTFKQFNTEISAIKRTGAAKAGLLEKEAGITKKSGKAALISGVLGAGSTVGGNIFKGKAAGVF
jgi:hypothetical protein